MKAFRSGMKSTLLPAVSLVVLAAPVMAADSPPPVESVPQNDNLNAVLWDQTAVEFKGVTLGAYMLARYQLDEALADKSWTAAAEQAGDYEDLPPAIILDVDDTVLNTSQYQAWTVANDTAYSGETWTQYVRSKKDVAIPGAVDFLKYADSKGVKIFYVTNRTSEEEGPTVEEMTAMGFPMGGNVDTFLSAKERPDWGSAKGTRRAYIAKDYRILMLFGDNLGDFSDDYSASVADRDKVFEANMAHWGHDWIVIPNPTYGSFESAPFLNDYSKAVDERRQLKIDALQPWSGPQN